MYLEWMVCSGVMLYLQRYGEERVEAAREDGQPRKMRKVMVFLNPTANKR